MNFENSSANLKFYLSIAGLLIDSLKTENEKIIANSWLIKLKSEDISTHKKLQFLRIFLTCLRRNFLVGPFVKYADKEGINEIICKYGCSYIQKRALYKEFENGSKNTPLTPLPQRKKLYSIFLHVPGVGGHFYTTACAINIEGSKTLKKLNMPLGTSSIIPAMANLY